MFRQSARSGRAGTRQAARGHGLSAQYARTDPRKYSFAVRTVDKWNKLPDEVKMPLRAIPSGKTADTVNTTPFLANMVRNYCLSPFATSSRVVDPHHFDADPDADPDPDFYLMRRRIQVTKMMWILHNNAFHSIFLVLNTVRVHSLALLVK
jgi:hypothetical protein